MGETTAIAWTDHTFNPWWGCSRVSPGCDHCYAETFAKRTGHAVWGKDGSRRFFGDKHWAEPLKWDRQAAADGRQHRVFCASMADVFERHDGLMFERQRLWNLIAETPHLDWQLLTKRPENVARMVPADWMGIAWPANVWLGTTVEDQLRANLRVPRLLALPAPIRFLSCEPLLGPVDLRPHLADRGEDGWAYVCQLHGLEECRQMPECSGVQWVIVGGESGPNHRPLNLDHARSLRDQCMAANVPLFFKQVGGRTPTAGGDELDGCTHKAFPIRPQEAKQGDRGSA